jgi:hypothetical protein
MFRQFGSWFGDRIGLRYLLIYVAVEYRVALLQRQIVQQAAFGRDGWLFWIEQTDGSGRPQMADINGRLRFQPAQIATIETNLHAVHDRLAACGIKFLNVIAPNKESIYGEMAGGNEALARTRLDDLLERLTPSARPMVLDLRPALRTAAAKDTAVPLYFKSDTHWNELGAFYAYRAILDAIERKFVVPNPGLAKLENFTVVQHPFHGGDIAKTFFMPSRFPDTEVLLRPESSLPEVEAEEISPLNWVFRAKTERILPLLMFGDSFAPSLGRFLARHFGTVYTRPTRVDGKQIAEITPRVVLVENVARYGHQLLDGVVDLDRACDRPPPRTG